MSGTTFRLETQRTRPPPPPLRVQKPARPFNTLSPPTSPRSNSGIVTPSSPPGRSPGRSRRASRNPRPTPPPSARHRSTTPLGAARSDLEAFAEQCRQWYFNQDEDSGRIMTQTLSNLPPSQRAPFSRLQASIRSTYHANVNARRNAEFRAHLAATLPGCSLMPHARADPTGPEAKKERLDRFDRFVRTWCTMGMPGTKPFFEALWAVMRLQVIPEHLGGAGGRRIEWEIDDAVFKEAAGKDFMFEAIDTLKGVLAFEEAIQDNGSPTSATFDPEISVSPFHTRAQSQPLPSPDMPSPKAAPIATTTHAKRARAPSDPFLDTPALSRSLASASSHSSGNTTAGGLSTLGESTRDDPPSPSTPPEDKDGLLALPSRSERVFSEDCEGKYMRTWTSPDLLSNAEYLSLLKVFPSFITRRPLPRFPPPSRRLQDAEEGVDERSEGKEIRFGTGTMWVSSKPRTGEWNGGWWSRFILWWRRIFC
ncbi:hypothetical protein PLICRDRAFT_486546 [Plicaturopsis crispa FD-325 SS-3]|nr:hypothetical protein PLICRDRAFT_486546 [Plicaturopsis crispa FD-325 SS-3]